MRKFHVADFIGRFSPVHLGHGGVIRVGLDVADIVDIKMGSSNAARRHDYVPFTAAEREEMIRSMFTAEENARLRFSYIEDQGDMKDWTALIRNSTHEIEPDDSKITLLSHMKDNSSFYQRAFPEWEKTLVDNIGGLSATPFRNAFFSPGFKPDDIRVDALHPNVQEWLIEFSKRPEYEYLVEEGVKCREDLQKYGRLDHKGVLRYSAIAADAIFVLNDHVLVIRRGNYPFKGHLAFPGGIVEPDEDVVEAAIRESSKEEARFVDIDEDTIRRSVVHTQHFAAPFRDPRGRVITFATLFDLNKGLGISRNTIVPMPKVVAGDDAAAAFMMPIPTTGRSDWAFDHFSNLHIMLRHR